MKSRLTAALLLFLLLVAAFMLARLPGTCMDSVVARLSDERVRLVNVEGSFWSGSGLLALSADRRHLRPARALAWRFGLRRDGPGVTLTLSEHGQRQVLIVLSPTGWLIEDLHIELGLDLIAAAVPHPVARAGWRGRLSLDAQGLACNWQPSCEGELQVRWFDAGLDIVPGRPLGTHALAMQALGNRFNLDLNTLEGDIRIQGQGQFTPSGQFNFSASVEGDPEIVDRIPNIMDRNARASGTTGKVLITLP